MAESNKPKSFWIGIIVFAYSAFLFLQGLWVYASYKFIFPGIYWVPAGYVPNNDWVFQMIAGILPSVGGGIIFMLVGLYIKTRDKVKRSIGIAILCYSFILALPTIWLLFFFPNFYPQLIRYMSTNIFINYPFFFNMLGVVIPPAVGALLFMATGLVTIKNSIKVNQPESKNQ